MPILSASCANPNQTNQTSNMKTAIDRSKGATPVRTSQEIYPNRTTSYTERERLVRQLSRTRRALERKVREESRTEQEGESDGE